MKIIDKLSYRWDNLSFFVRSKYQKLRYGYEFQECWNFDHALSKWAVPRLRYLRDNCYSVPMKRGGKMMDDGPETYTMDEWKAILDEIIFAFDFNSREGEYSDNCYTKDHDFGFTIDAKGYIIWNDDRKPDYTEYDKLKARADAGMKLFAEHFNALND